MRAVLLLFYKPPFSRGAFFMVKKIRSLAGKGFPGIVKNTAKDRLVI